MPTVEVTVQPGSVARTALSQAGPRLQVLDYFSLEMDGRSVAVGGSGTEVLAYLGVVGPAPRDRLRTSLWPDAAPEEALARLRSLLYRLRHAGAGELVVSGPGNLIRLSASLLVDYQQANSTAEDLGLGRPRSRAGLEAALRELSGDLLPDDTAEWLAPHQRHWSRRRLIALASCARIALTLQDCETAIRAAELVLRTEPFFEEMHEVIVQALIMEGFLASAREAYERCRLLLRDELDCAPRRTFREVVGGVALRSSAER